MNSTYTLTAHLGLERKTKTIHADTQIEATLEAITHVLDKAYENQTGAWANGVIVLSDSDGFAIHTMDAKK